MREKSHGFKVWLFFVFKNAPDSNVYSSKCKNSHLFLYDDYDKVVQRQPYRCTVYCFSGILYT